MRHDTNGAVSTATRGRAQISSFDHPRVNGPVASGSMRSTLNDVELAERLGISRKTLQKWRSLGTGPAYLKLGAKVVYRIEDIDAYIQRSLRVHR